MWSHKWHHVSCAIAALKLCMEVKKDFMLAKKQLERLPQAALSVQNRTKFSN